MKTKIIPLFFIIILVLLFGVGSAAGKNTLETRSPDAAVSSTISYQGVLRESGVPVTGSRDMFFRLYADGTCTTQVGTDIVQNGVSVSDGLFNVALPVDQADFNGQAIWLQVSVAGTALGCEAIMPVPYALSLRPGAVISGTVSFSINDGGVINVHNTGTGNAAELNSNWNGLQIASDNLGIYIYDSQTAIQVENVEYGFYAVQTDEDGVYVESAGGDGVHVETALKDGVYAVSFGGASYYGGNFIGHNGVSGVANAAAGIGVYGSTDDVNSKWGLYTPDSLYVGTTMSSAGPLTMVAQNGGDRPLQIGDVVVANGIGASLVDRDLPVPLVQHADAHHNMAVGIVYDRLVVDQNTEIVQGADGLVAPGEYLLIAVLGVAEVKVDPDTGQIAVGDRLTVSETGHGVRTLQTRFLDGVTVTEGAPSLGFALAPMNAETGTVLVFITLK